MRKEFADKIQARVDGLESHATVPDTAASHETKGATMTPISPLPWRVVHVQARRELVTLKSADGYVVADMRVCPSANLDVDEEANARFICQAVNGHHGLLAKNAELLAALTQLDRAIDGYLRGESAYVSDCGLALVQARQRADALLIAKAEGR